MPDVRFFCLTLCAILLAACASSAPQRRTHTLTVPPPVKTASVQPNHALANQSLEICPGMRVSNAPAVDSNRRLAGYQSYSRVHGVTLARAPVDSCLSSGFGQRQGQGGAGRHHKGVDLYTRTPAPIYAGGDGVVEAIETLRGYGLTVLIRHNDRVKTRYAHLSSYAQGLHRGQRVRQGDFIGRTGRTGNATAVHLHYEILIDGRPRDPLSIRS